MRQQFVQREDRLTGAVVVGQGQPQPQPRTFGQRALRKFFEQRLQRGGRLAGTFRPVQRDAAREQQVVAFFHRRARRRDQFQRLLVLARAAGRRRQHGEIARFPLRPGVEFLLRGNRRRQPRQHLFPPAAHLFHGIELAVVVVGLAGIEHEVGERLRGAGVPRHLGERLVARLGGEPRESLLHHVHRGGNQLRVIRQIELLRVAAQRRGVVAAVPRERAPPAEGVAVKASARILREVLVEEFFGLHPLAFVELPVGLLVFRLARLPQRAPQRHEQRGLGARMFGIVRGHLQKSRLAFRDQPAPPVRRPAQIEPVRLQRWRGFGRLPLDLRVERGVGFGTLALGGVGLGLVEAQAEAVHLFQTPLEIRRPFFRRGRAGENLAQIVEQVEQGIGGFRARGADHFVDGGERRRAGLFWQGEQLGLKVDPGRRRPGRGRFREHLLEGFRRELIEPEVVGEGLERLLIKAPRGLCGSLR